MSLFFLFYFIFAYSNYYYTSINQPHILIRGVGDGVELLFTTTTKLFISNNFALTPGPADGRAATMHLAFCISFHLYDRGPKMKLHWHAIQYVLFLTYFLFTDENALALPTRSRTKSNNFLRSENRVDGDSDVNAGTGQEAGWCHADLLKELKGRKNR